VERDLDVLNSVNFHELDWTLGRHRELLEHLVPLTFLSNHDVTRVASQISDARHYTHAVALLAFLPGIPSIYYGDEFGLRAIKEQRPGGDDSVRPELPGQRGLFTEPHHPDVEVSYQRMVGLRRRHPWLVDAIVSTAQVANAHLVVHAQGRRQPDRRLTLALTWPTSRSPSSVNGEVLEASSPVAETAVPASRMGGPRTLTYIARRIRESPRRPG
jgi:glycosidase